MPGFDTQLSTTKAEPASAYNTGLGFILFCIYLVFYGVFVILSAFWPETMDVVVAGGANLGIVYGFALIASAFLLALFYAWLCRPTAVEVERPILP